MRLMAVLTRTPTVRKTSRLKSLAVVYWMAGLALALTSLGFLTRILRGNRPVRHLSNTVMLPAADDPAFDLLDALKRPELQDAPRGRVLPSAAVRQLQALREGDQIVESVDDLFWQTLLAGAHALGQANFWMASRQLGFLVDTVLVSLARSAGGTFPLPWTPRERETFLRDLAAQSADGLSAEAAATAMSGLCAQYAAVADAYRRLRPSPPSPRNSLGEAEQLYRDWLRNAPSHPTLHTHEVITWRHLSLVLPAYNEEEVIAETVEACLHAVQAYCPNAEILVVDDGSRDGTGAIADGLALRDATVVALHNRPNRGYGGALRSGFDAAEGDLVFFMDSDGQFDIREIRKLLLEERRTPGAAVLGYRAKRSDSFMRKLNAAGWKRAAHVVVGLKGIRDIDCAFKLLPAGPLRRCAIQASGASINVEFLAKLQRQGIPLVQLPVSHHPRTKGSPTGANWRVIVRAFDELFRLRRHLATWAPAAAEDPDAEAVAMARFSTRRLS